MRTWLTKLCRFKAEMGNFEGVKNLREKQMSEVKRKADARLLAFIPPFLYTLTLMPKYFWWVIIVK